MKKKAAAPKKGKSRPVPARARPKAAAKKVPQKKPAVPARKKAAGLPKPVPAKAPTAPRTEQPAPSSDGFGYVEVRIKCAECGKEVKVITLDGTDTAHYLCARCSSGEFFEDEEDF